MNRPASILTALALAACPVPIHAHGMAIHSIEVGQADPVNTSQGDTWDLAWAKDGSIYTTSDDTHGFHSSANSDIAFNQVMGDDPTKLDGKTINTMVEYGLQGQRGPDGCTWKSSGCISLNGVLYLLVARHKYGEESGDFEKRQPAHNASFIKSTDGGKTWTRSEQENYDHPMFPGSRFATPYFIQYGQDGHEAVADGSDKYVYALSNNGFWDNGDYLVLGRVPRSKMPDLNAAEWQFYKEGNGATDAAWTSNIRDAQAVLCDPNHLGMTRAVYLPKQKCYFMIGWYYPDGGAKLPNAATHTRWNFIIAPHPWGPWKSVGTHDFSPQGFYSPGICQKYTSADGTKLFAFTAGIGGEPYYRMTVVPITLQ